MLTVKQADTITLDWIEAHVDLDQARASYSLYPFQRESEKLNRPEYEPLGDWAMDSRDGMIYALVEVGVDEVHPGEGEWEIALQYETTRQYIEWFRQGHQPPPVFVIRNKTGELISLNRRRWLAARAAGVEKLRAFYSPSVGVRPAWELKPCTWDKEHVCKIYAQGGDCFSCPYYKEVRCDDS